MTLKLLLAGKEIANFQPIKDAFNNEDAMIITATSMALALYLARKNQPDLIISQEQLTDSDGLSLFYELKNEDELRKIPFALVLASSQKRKNDLDVSAKSKDNLFESRAFSSNVPILFLGDANLEDTNNISQGIFSLKERIISLLSS